MRMHEETIKNSPLQTHRTQILNRLQHEPAGGDSTHNSLVSIAVGWTDSYRSVNSTHLVNFKWYGTLIQERERLPTVPVRKAIK